MKIHKKEGVDVHLILDESEYQRYAASIDKINRATLIQYNDRFELSLNNLTLTLNTTESEIQFSYEDNNEYMQLIVYNGNKLITKMPVLVKVIFLTSWQIKTLIKRLVDKRGLRKNFIASELGLSVSSLLKWSKAKNSTPCKKVYVTILEQMIAGQ